MGARAAPTRASPATAAPSGSLRAGQPVSVPIKTGITDGTLTEVVAGDLHEGDDVITEAPSEPTSRAASRPALRF